MNFDLGVDQNRQRVLLVAGAIVLIVLLFGRGGRAPVVSSWNGEGAPPAAPERQEAGVLTGLFAQQQQVTPSGKLATLPQEPDLPWGNPTDSDAAVMTQGYGVGTHAPAAAWGAIDLAIDGNGDGGADPGASDGAPIYATHRGVVKITPNSVPGGNHIWVTGERYKTGYAHLKGFAVDTGQVVERGTLIGYMGSTGLSSGPHLDYQVWRDGVNQNPLDYGVLP